MVNWRVNPGRISARLARRAAAGARKRSERWRPAGRLLLRPPSRLFTRSRISSAALLVNVTARMQGPGTRCCLHQVRDAMRDHPRLAAAGAGQHQQRTFDVRNGGLLLRI